MLFPTFSNMVKFGLHDRPAHNWDLSYSHYYMLVRPRPPWGMRLCLSVGNFYAASTPQYVSKHHTLSLLCMNSRRRHARSHFTKTVSLVVHFPLEIGLIFHCILTSTKPLYVKARGHVNILRFHDQGWMTANYYFQWNWDSNEISSENLARLRLNLSDTVYSNSTSVL